MSVNVCMCECLFARLNITCNFGPHHTGVYLGHKLHKFIWHLWYVYMGAYPGVDTFPRTLNEYTIVFKCVSLLIMCLHTSV